MTCFDKSHGRRIRCHHDRVSKDVLRSDSHTFCQRSVHDTGRSKTYIFSASKVLRPKNGGKISDPRFLEARLVFLIRRLPSTDYLTTDAAHRGGGDAAPRAPACSDEHVHRICGETRCEPHSDIAVGKKLDASARPTHLGYQLVVPRPLQYRDGDF